MADKLSLATKYRPSGFDAVIEQSLIVNMLKNMCSQEKLTTRNFLFIGPAGCGKTTLGRIVGNVLNGVAENIESDLIEIDAASHSGVDDVRELVQQARQFPLLSRWKIFIMDECHAFSKAAWDAWLKPLEEGLANSIFIFCTTNPEKIPATIISRVTDFNLSKISLDGIVKQLTFVIEAEIKEGRKITYTEDAVMYIAKLAAGGMRDALTLLDKSLSHTLDITSESLMESLSLPDYADYFKLIVAYVKQDNDTIVNLVHNVYNSGVNFVKWFEGFHSFVINIVKYIFTKDINKTMIPSHYNDQMGKYNVTHANVCLKLANHLLKMNHELKTTNYQQEIALTYLCQVQQVKK